LASEIDLAKVVAVSARQKKIGYYFEAYLLLSIVKSQMITSSERINRIIQ